MATRAASRLAIFLIEIYRKTISPLLGPRCRFHPSCSEYSSQAIKTHGLRRGAVMAVSRVARCNPFNAGGYDPVEK
ncbi:membrane protein insertion efficiency factor YidD [Candidatus Mycalebacterium sp.]